MSTSPDTSNDRYEKLAYVAAAIVIVCAIMFAIWGGREICGDHMNLRLGDAELDIPVMPMMKGSSALVHPDRGHPSTCHDQEPMVRSVVFSAATPQQKQLYLSEGYHYLPFLTVHLDPAPRDFERANCAYALKSTAWKNDAAHPNFQSIAGKGTTYYASKKPLLYGRRVFITCSGADCDMKLATDMVAIGVHFSTRELPSQWAAAMAEVEKFVSGLGIVPDVPQSAPVCR